MGNYDFIRKYSNAKLLELNRDVAARPASYRGTGISTLISQELAKRRASGQIRADAGKKRPQPQGFAGYFRY